MPRRLHKIFVLERAVLLMSKARAKTKILSQSRRRHEPIFQSRPVYSSNSVAARAGVLLREFAMLVLGSTCPAARLDAPLGRSSSGPLRPVFLMKNIGLIPEEMEKSVRCQGGCTKFLFWREQLCS